MRITWSPLHIEQTVQFPSKVEARLKPIGPSDRAATAALLCVAGREVELPDLVGVVPANEPAWVLDLAANPMDSLLLVGGAIIYRVTDRGEVATTLRLDRPQPLGTNSGVLAQPLGNRVALVYECGVTLINRKLDVVWTVAKSPDERSILGMNRPLCIVLEGSAGRSAILAEDGARVPSPPLPFLP